jgi:hypothetical protein
MCPRLRLLIPLLLLACTTQSPVRTIQAFRAARERGDDVAMRSYLAPDARMWFEKREGPGNPLGGNELWRHWDLYFHGHSTFTDWKVNGNVVTAIGNETNDFYTLTDWKPAPFRQTWWLDEQGRITGILLESLGKQTSRFREAVAWGKAHHPDEIAYLMPKGEIDPSGDRAERWKVLLEEWRRSGQ